MGVSALFTTFAIMFWRKKTNRSGTVTVQVLRKERWSRKNIVVSTLGTSSDEDEIEALCYRAQAMVNESSGGNLFAGLMEEDTPAARYDRIMSSIAQDQLRLVGPELVYGTLFDKVGYGKIKTHNLELLRALVVARLYKPASKLRTAEYMRKFMHKSYTCDQIYYFLDKLCARPPKKKAKDGEAQGAALPKEDAEEEKASAEDKPKDIKWQVEQITFDNTKKRMGGNVSVVFYDTTTLFFESRESDMLVPGYSKDGKHSNPQVVLGLLVGTGGNPIGYELHKGNQYEGTTMVPIIRKLQKRFAMPNPTVIADAGLLNKDNIAQLEADGYEYILGARIRSLKESDKNMIMGLGLKNGEAKSVAIGEKRMVVSMSDGRAKKEAKERQKGVEKLKKKFKSGKLTKASVNNRGYNSLLTLEGEATVYVDDAKIEAASKLDGLKGYITNSKMSDDDIIANYRYLFMIERAFKMNKTDLDIRPMYHRLFNRIEGHVCICFMAYTIMLELERILKEQGSPITLYRAMFLVESIYELCYTNPYTKKPMAVLLKTPQDSEVSQLLAIMRKVEAMP